MTSDPYGNPPPDSTYSSAPPNFDLPPEPGYFPPPDRSEAASKKLAAGLTGILLGSLGVHKFILGYTNAGIILLAVTLAAWVIAAITCGFGAPLVAVPGVIGLVEGIIYLTKSDEEFYQTYMVGKKEWF